MVEWRLSQAFHVNPNIDESDNRPNIENAINSAGYYDLINLEAHAYVVAIKLNCFHVLLITVQPGP